MRTRTLRGRPRFHLYPPRFASGWVPAVRHSTKKESTWAAAPTSRPCNLAAITTTVIRKSTRSTAGHLRCQLMVICLGRSAAALGTRMVRTPSLIFASIFLSSTSAGNEIS